MHPETRLWLTSEMLPLIIIGLNSCCIVGSAVGLLPSIALPQYIKKGKLSQTRRPPGELSSFEVRLNNCFAGAQQRQDGLRSVGSLTSVLVSGANLLTSIGWLSNSIFNYKQIHTALVYLPWIGRTMAISSATVHCALYFIFNDLKQAPRHSRSTATYSEVILSRLFTVAVVVTTTFLFFGGSVAAILVLTKDISTVSTRLFAEVSAYVDSATTLSALVAIVYIKHKFRGWGSRVDELETIATGNGGSAPDGLERRLLVFIVLSVTRCATAVLADTIGGSTIGPVLSFVNCVTVSCCVLACTTFLILACLEHRKKCAEQSDKVSLGLGADLSLECMEDRSANSDCMEATCPCNNPCM